MSINNFIPTWWSGNFISALRKASVFASPMVVNRNWEGEIKHGGDTVKITQIGDVSVVDYVKNSTTLEYPALDDASALLKADQVKSWSFSVDDVDAAQAIGDISKLGMDQAVYKVKDTQDSYIAGLYAQAGVTSGLGTTGTPLTVTAKASSGSNISIIELLARIRSALTTANCPTEGRFIVLPPDLITKLIMASVLDIRAASTAQEAATNGFIGKVFGFNVLESNNVVNTASAKYKVLAGTTAAITFAEQLNKVEAINLINTHGEGIRGLSIYGAKIVQANALACATVSTASEA